MKRLLLAIDDTYMGFLFWATSSKKAAYILSLLILVAVLIDPPKSIQAALLVVISEYYQGVALPAIGAVSKRAELAAKEEGQITRQLLQETHDTSMRQFAEVKALHAGQSSEIAEIRAVHDEMHEKLDHIIAMLEGGKRHGRHNRS